MLNTCIVCSSDTNLNTELVITIDDDKIKVLLCDEHAEDTTVKAAKEYYMTKKKHIDDFIAEAAKMGLTFVPNQGSSVIGVQQAPQPQQKPQQPTVAQQQSIEEPDDYVFSTDTDINFSDSVTSVNGVVTTNDGASENIESHGSLSAADFTDLKAIRKEHTKGNVKVESFQGRDGRRVNIATSKSDGLGRTSIRINNVDTDQKLQERFKANAQKSMNDDESAIRFSQSYGIKTSTCNLCRGKCVVLERGRKIDCPKCGGIGTIDIQL